MLPSAEARDREAGASTAIVFSRREKAERGEWAGAKNETSGGGAVELGGGARLHGRAGGGFAHGKARPGARGEGVLR